MWEPSYKYHYLATKKKLDKSKAELKQEVEKGFTKRKERELHDKILDEIKEDIEQLPVRGISKRIEFTPENEQGVVLLFSRYFESLGFDKIVTIQQGFPDCVTIRNDKEVKIEFELLSSSFLQHGHSLTETDYVVCWENDVLLKGVKIIELKSKLKWITK